MLWLGQFVLSCTTLCGFMIFIIITLSESEVCSQNSNYLYLCITAYISDFFFYAF